jgi:hypothetical protein
MMGFTPQCNMYRGYQEKNTRSLEHRGDAGWGVARHEPTHAQYAIRWYDVTDDAGTVVGRVSRLISQPMRTK